MRHVSGYLAMEYLLTGVFCRSAKDQPWKRLKAEGTREDLFGYQQMFPDREIALFEYPGGFNRSYDAFSVKRMRRIL